MNATPIETYQWRETFAWFPVETITKKKVWLKKVWKRKVIMMYGVAFHYEPEVQYATTFDIMNDPYNVEYVDNFVMPPKKL